VQTAFVIIILAAAVLGVLLFYRGKLDWPDKMGSFIGNTDDAAKDLRLELEMIADVAIEKMEEKIAVMDILIKEAEEKSNQLDAKIKLVHSLQKEAAVATVAAAAAPAPKKPVPLFDTAEKELKKETVPLPQELVPPSAKAADNVFLPEREEALVQVKADFPTQGIFYSDKHRLALMMIQEGYELEDIAKVTSLVRGEIMLMQGLHDKNKQEGKRP
jgi:hypothetical protein